MNERVKKLWLQALRSGDYTQGQNWLKSSDECGDFHCCLGVLCDLFLTETGNGQWTPIQNDKFFTFEVERYSSPSVLPAPVMNWAELGDCNPRLGRVKVASVLNDTGKDFNYIADRIEKYL